MKRGKTRYRAFRNAFIILVGGALLLLAWQFSRRPPAPSRVTWPSSAPAKP